MNWPNQAETRPWPGAHAAAGGRLLCALAAHQNVQAHEQLLQLEAVPALLHALEEAWLNTCSAEILFYLADSPVPGALDKLRMRDGAAILVAYINRNVHNRRKRMRSYGPTAAENPPYHEVACLYYAVQLLILLAVRPDGDGDDPEDDTLKLGLPVPTQDIVEAVQAILGLMPPPKLAAAVQKLINCCPEARAALEEQALSSQDGRGSGWFSNAWKFMKRALEDSRETELAKSEKAV
ncbi:g10147 [Coccomyxa elongata]